MSKLPATTRTGRVQLGPGSDLVELQRDDGARYTAIVFHPEYRGHNALNAALGVVLGFLESPMVSGLEDLVGYDLGESTFAYATGPVWSVAEIVRTLADAGESAGVRAGLELLVQAGRVLVEAAEAGEAAAIYSHGGVTPWRLLVDAEGRVRVIGYALPQVEILMFHANPAQVPREDAFRYCPPERMEARKENWTSDIFGLALVAFELMTGKPVYDGLVDEIRARASRGETSRRLHQHKDLFPDATRELLNAALRAEIRDRFASGAEFLEMAASALRDRRLQGPTLREVMQRVAAAPTRARQALDPAKTSALSRDDLRAMIEADDEPTGNTRRRETVNIPTARASVDVAPVAPPAARPNPRSSGDVEAPRGVVPMRSVAPPVVAAPPLDLPSVPRAVPPPARANPRAPVDVMAPPPVVAVATPSPVAEPPVTVAPPPVARANPRVAPREAPGADSAAHLLARLRASGGGGDGTPEAGYEAAARLDRILRQSGSRESGAPPVPPVFTAPPFSVPPSVPVPPIAPPPPFAAPPVAPPPLSTPPPVPAPPVVPPRVAAAPPETPVVAPPPPAFVPSDAAAGRVMTPRRFVPAPAVADDEDEDDGQATAAFVRGAPPRRGVPVEVSAPVVTPAPASPAPASPAPASPSTPVPPAASGASEAATSASWSPTMTSTMRGEQVPFRLVRAGAPTQRRRLPADTTLAEVVALLLGQAIPVQAALDGTLEAGWRAGGASAPMASSTTLGSLGEDAAVHLHRVPARRVRARVVASLADGERRVVVPLSTVVPVSSLLEGLVALMELPPADWSLRVGGAAPGPFAILDEFVGAGVERVDVELVRA